MKCTAPCAYAPLGMAAAEGRNDLVNILLRAGARPDMAGDNRGTPLHEAVRHDHAVIVATLVKAEPEIARYDREGLHPLALAAARGSHGALETLLAAGIEPDLGEEHRLRDGGGKAERLGPDAGLARLGAAAGRG